MKLIRLNSFLYLFCMLSVFASCVQKPDSSVEDWDRTFINTKKPSNPQLSSSASFLRLNVLSSLN